MTAEIIHNQNHLNVKVGDRFRIFDGPVLHVIDVSEIGRGYTHETYNYLTGKMIEIAPVHSGETPIIIGATRIYST